MKGKFFERTTRTWLNNNNNNNNNNNDDDDDDDDDKSKSLSRITLQYISTFINGVLLIKN